MFINLLENSLYYLEKNGIAMYNLFSPETTNKIIMKGIIALDIDGTLTADIHRIPNEVAIYLEHLESEGWKICLITGRAFSLASSAIEELSFPFFLAIHNGALILEMPERTILKKYYLEKDVFPVMEEICAEEPTDFVIYSGIENDDHCYYRPHRFEKELLQYVEGRAQFCRESWKSVESYDCLTINGFSALKCFGALESLRQITERVEQRLEVHFPIIRDPLGEEMYIAQATHGEVSKGQAVSEVKGILGNEGPVIAAGDDNNDIPLLKAADYKIAMSGAPKRLQEIADLVAPSAEELGIIPALEQAIEWMTRKGLA